MAQNWYYAEGKQKLGPFSSTQLRQFAAAGRVQPTTMVWKEGAQRWVPANSVQGLFPPTPSPDGPEPLTADHPAAGGSTGLLDDLLVSLGAPRLGEPWTTQQKTIAILVCVGLFPLVLGVVILYGMYRLLVLWFTNRPKVVVKEPRSPSVMGRIVSGVLQPPSSSAPAQGGPYSRSPDGMNTHVCRHCRAYIRNGTSRCPYCTGENP